MADGPSSRRAAGEIRSDCPWCSRISAPSCGKLSGAAAPDSTPPPAEPGRVLALDLGTKRIGVALSDPSGTIAGPLETIAVSGKGRAVQHIADLCRSHRVGRVVVGWPRNMDGSRGPAARHAEAFATRLGAALPVPVELWDERLSTAAAERALIEAGTRRGERRERRDRVAASLFLQAYLDARRRVRPQGT